MTILRPQYVRCVPSLLALVSVSILALTLCSPGPARPSDDADSGSPISRLRHDVEFLASDNLDGRMTGTTGERQAADYIADELLELGVSPIPGENGLLVPFEFTSGSQDDGSTISLIVDDGASSWVGTEQVQALSFSDTARVSGEVVFAGYGLTVPDSQDFGYDSYATLDVEGKIVVVLRYFPEDLEGEARATLARYSGLRFKALTARENGAKALLVVTGPNSPNAGKTIRMSFDTAVAGSGIVAASISAKVAEELFDAIPGQTLKSAQTAMDAGNPHVAGFVFPGLFATVDAKVRRETRQGLNVTALLEGEHDQRGGAIVVGAHYDHLGRGRGGNSLAKKEETGNIHNGADDNASGVAAVLEVARRLSQAKLGRDVVVAFWSGEELGLLGSNAFVKTGVPAGQPMAAYLNLDMVGRMRDNKLTVQAVGSSEAWPQLLERTNVPVGFDLQIQQDPYLPTDSASFNAAGIPSLNLFTGGHSDYHRPTDDADTLNYEDLERVARFAAGLAQRLSNLDQAPGFVQVTRRTESGGDRDSVRAFTGTIPDYTTETQGLRLGGVIGGGPAEEAGLREGDIIVEFGGTKITNIYDYTYALDAVKVDVTIPVIFLRDGKRMETEITPRSRR